MTAKKKRNAIDWVGGIVPPPVYVAGGGEPFQPSALTWLGIEGLVVGFDVDWRDALIVRVGESLQRAIDRPMAGPSQAPTRVHVDSPKIAETLRHGHPGIEFACAPTPEIDQEFAATIEKMEAEAVKEASYLTASVRPDVTAGFLGAAAELFQAEPWTTVPSHEASLSVTVDSGCGRGRHPATPDGEPSHPCRGPGARPGPGAQGGEASACRVG